MARMTLEQIAAARPWIDQARVDARGEELPSAAVRERVGLSQVEFAAALMVPLGTLPTWEQGRVRPDPAARALLRIVAHDPKVALAALGWRGGKGVA
jgi:putative transcriptional regulator